MLISYRTLPCYIYRYLQYPPQTTPEVNLYSAYSITANKGAIMSIQQAPPFSAPFTTRLSASQLRNMYLKSGQSTTWPPPHVHLAQIPTGRWKRKITVHSVSVVLLRTVHCKESGCFGGRVVLTQQIKALSPPDVQPVEPKWNCISRGVHFVFFVVWSEYLLCLQTCHPTMVTPSDCPGQRKDSGTFRGHLQLS